MFAPIRLTTESDGMVWGYSRALGLDVCWVDGELRFRDPVTGVFLGEFTKERDLEREARIRAETERVVAEAERDLAEARANEAQAEIQRLRRLLDNQ